MIVVRFLRPSASPLGAFQPGERAAVPPDVAEAWREDGLVELVGEDLDDREDAGDEQSAAGPPSAPETAAVTPPETAMLPAARPRGRGRGRRS